jgi:hypothetical protein
MLETAMLKVFSSDKQWEVLFETMQIFGGRSFFTDHPFERMMRDARLNTIGEGSNDVLRAFIGLVGMRDIGMKFKDVADSLKSGSIVGKVFGLGKDAVRKLLVTPEVPVKSQQLQHEAQELGTRVRKFGLAVQKLIVHYKENILEAQLELNRIAESAMAIYGMTAVLSKLDTQLARGEDPGDDLAIGKLYCRLALDTIDAQLDSITSSTDKQITDVAKRLTGI